jgi:hypothetical protein
MHELDRITQQQWEHADQPGIKLLTKAQQFDETASALGKKVKKRRHNHQYIRCNKQRQGALQ